MKKIYEVKEWLLVDVHNRDQGKFQTEKLTLFQKMEIFIINNIELKSMMKMDNKIGEYCYRTINQYYLLCLLLLTN